MFIQQESKHGTVIILKCVKERGSFRFSRGRCRASLIIQIFFKLYYENEKGKKQRDQKTDKSKNRREKLSKERERETNVEGEEKKQKTTEIEMETEKKTKRGRDRGKTYTKTSAKRFELVRFTKKASAYSC